MKIQVASQSGVIVYMDGATPEIQNQRVCSLTDALLTHTPEWLTDVVPSYHSLLVLFDPFQTDMFEVKARLRRLAEHPSSTVACHRSVITLPVWYEAPVDNDYQRIRHVTGLNPRQIKEIHTSARFRVYAVGFAPGFAFLGHVPESLRVPRLNTPRKEVIAGAVAVAEDQTAVYPRPSPGGWNIIGQCPLDLTPGNANTFAVGDEVRFTPIDEPAFTRLKGRRLSDFAK